MNSLVAEYLAHDRAVPVELWAEVSLLHVKAAKAHFLHSDTKLGNMLCNAVKVSDTRRRFVPGRRG